MANDPHVAPLLAHVRLAVLSGLAGELFEGSGRHGTAFRTACHEALAALVRRRHVFSSTTGPRTLSLAPASLYMSLRATISTCAAALLRDAHERESMIIIRHPSGVGTA